MTTYSTVAQIPDESKRAGMHSPLGFTAFIPMVGAPRKVGDWIVGALNEDLPPRTYRENFVAQDPESGAWFGQLIGTTKLDPLGWVKHYGAFRETDWRKAEYAAVSSDVSEHIRKLTLPPD